MADYQAGADMGPNRFRSGGDKPLPYGCLLYFRAGTYPAHEFGTGEFSFCRGGVYPLPNVYSNSARTPINCSTRAAESSPAGYR